MVLCGFSKFGDTSNVGVDKMERFGLHRTITTQTGNLRTGNPEKSI